MTQTPPISADDRHWLTCLDCGWIRSVNNNPPITADGFCTTCGNPAEDPFDIAKEDRAASIPTSRGAETEATADLWRENVEAMLSSGDPDVIRCHEGGGPEDLIGSLVLTVMRTRNARDKALSTLKGEPNA